MTFLDKVYKSSPVLFQNIMVSTYGYIILRQRYKGASEKYVTELEKSQWFSLDKLKEIQMDRLKKMLKHAYANVPYYRNLFNSIGLIPDQIKTIEDLKKLPPIDKSIVRKHLRQFIPTNIGKDKLIAINTGGTTGTPLTVYMTKDAIQHLFAWSEARIKHWAGVKSGDKLASFLHSGDVLVPINQKKPPFWRWNRAYNQLLFSVFHMSENNLKYYVEKYNRFRPQIVQGYVTAVHIFAKYILTHQLDVLLPRLFF